MKTSNQTSKLEHDGIQVYFCFIKLKFKRSTWEVFTSGLFRSIEITCLNLNMNLNKFVLHHFPYALTNCNCFKSHTPNLKCKTSLIRVWALLLLDKTGVLQLPYKHLN